MPGRRVSARRQVFAALRNVLLILLRALGHTNVAAALRRYGAFAEWALRLIGQPRGGRSGSHNSEA
jgi:hypothetical protein